MYGLNYFFRISPELSNFISFRGVHVYILIVALILSVGILSLKREGRRLELCIGSVLITQQVILYSWYLIGGYNTLREGLPLYHCRVAIICVGLGLLLNKRVLMKFGAYWGIFGSIGALLFPGLDPFLFPHITQFSYFVGHLFLLWASLYILFIKKVGMTSRELKNTLLFTNTYHILMIILNKILNSNYGYMKESPVALAFDLNYLAYVVCVMMIFNIVVCIEYKLLNRVKNKGKEAELVLSK